ANPVWIQATGTNNWTFATPTLNDHTAYTIVARAASPSGQVQSVFILGSSSFTVVIDQTNPSAVITPLPAQNISYHRANIGLSRNSSLFGGTASDGGALASGVK